jgi:ferredoxin-NAD(P)+ reductase (naphthalene dioxygenase ferredoxin-specific)
MEKIEARVVSHRLLNSYIHHLVLRPLDSREIDFKAGQFVLFQITPEITRAYSFANPEHIRDQLEFIIDVRPGGPGSQFTQKVKKDDRIVLHGPLGHFVLQPREIAKVFVATGCAIAPLKSMIETALHHKDAQSISLLWGLRHLRDIYLDRHFQELELKYPNFLFTLCISRPEKSNPYFTGRVTEVIKTAIAESADYYLCGREAMIGDVKEILRRRGVAEEHIFFEGFESQTC